MSILYIFITCEARFTRCYDRIMHMMQSHTCNDFIIVKGGASAHSFDETTHILNLQCDDYYEGLSEKIFTVCKYISSTPHFNKYTHFCKVDDDITVKKLLVPKLVSDYWGKLFPGHPGSPRWHYGKCHNANFNNKEYTGPWVPWCAGGTGYVISRKALEIIAADTTLYERIVKDINENSVLHRLYFIYEDVYIAYTLLTHGINPTPASQLHQYLYSPDHKY